MKLTTKMLKQIIKEEIDAVMGEGGGWYYNQGVADAEIGDNRSDEYKDEDSKRKYLQGHASVSAQAEMELPMDGEMAGMDPENEYSGGDYQPSGTGRVSPGAGPKIRDYRAKLRSRYRK